MANAYALLQADGTLLFARPKSGGWAVSAELTGVDAHGKNLTVFLSGLDVLGVSATIPARNENEARRAAPFAIEDELAQSVEESHIALAPADKTDLTAPRAMNAVSISTFREIIGALNAKGLEESAIVAAHSVLPAKEMLFEGPGVILGRLGVRSFAIDPSLGRDVLVSLLDQHPDAKVHGPRTAQAVGRDLAGEGTPSLEAFLIQLANWSEGGNAGIDLRQGDFRPRRSVDLGGFAQWRVAGAIAAAAALGWFGITLGETMAMNDRSAELEALSEEFARVGWPEANGDVQQVLALTQNSRSESNQAFPSVLDATAVLYESMEQVEGSELRSIRYDRLRRQMTITVAFESFADVDRLTTIVNEAGLSARSGDSRQSGAKVVGDLTLGSGS